MRNDENHGLSNCRGSIWCVDCAGTCSQGLLGEEGPYKPHPELWPQKPVEIPGPEYLDRFRNYLRQEARRGGAR
jgi:hypothetical protein